MSGYLERLVERGRTTLGALRGPAAHTEEPDLNLVESEEQAPEAASPRAGAERVVIAEPIIRVESHVEQPAEARVQPAQAAEAAPAPPPPRGVQPAESAAVPARSAPGHPAPAVRPPWLRDAGIRSAEPVKQPATRPAEPPAAPASSIDRPAKPQEPPSLAPSAKRPEAVAMQSPPARDVRLVQAPAAPGQRPEIPPAQIERWHHLRERLLIEHPPAAVAAPRESLRPLQQPPGTRLQAARSAMPAPGEVVIRNLEVTVAAPPSHVPPAPAPQAAAQPPVTAATGAWTLAARRYLGRI